MEQPKLINCKRHLYLKYYFKPRCGTLLRQSGRCRQSSKSLLRFLKLVSLGSCKIQELCTIFVPTVQETLWLYFRHIIRHIQHNLRISFGYWPYQKLLKYAFLHVCTFPVLDVTICFWNRYVISGCSYLNMLNCYHL